MQLFLLLSLTLDAVAIAAQALVATHLGAGEGARARAVGERLVGLGVYVGAALGVVLFLAAPLLGGLFTQAAEVEELATQLLIWVALLQPVGAIAFTLDGILIGASDTGFLAVAMVGATVVFVGSMLLLYGSQAGIWSLIIGMSAWMTVRAASTVLRFRGTRWLEAA